MQKSFDEFEFPPDPLAALECLKNRCLHIFLVDVARILWNLDEV